MKDMADNFFANLRPVEGHLRQLFMARPGS